MTVIAVNTNVAMNASMNAWNPDQLPANWQAVRDEWLVAMPETSFSIPLFQYWSLWAVISTGPGLEGPSLDGPSLEGSGLENPNRG